MRSPQRNTCGHNASHHQPRQWWMPTRATLSIISGMPGSYWRWRHWSDIHIYHHEDIQKPTDFWLRTRVSISRTVDVKERFPPKVSHPPRTQHHLDNVNFHYEKNGRTSLVCHGWCQWYQIQEHHSGWKRVQYSQTNKNKIEWREKYLFFSLLLAGSSLYAQEWPAVRPETSPCHPLVVAGSAVDATNLTYNLEEYAKAGLGGKKSPYLWCSRQR